jgi:hypothetical protein
MKIAAISLGIVAVAAVVAIVGYEWHVAWERESVDEIRAELDDALPVGSSEATIDEYLTSRALPHGASTVSAEESRLDTFYVESGIEAGTRVINAGMQEDGSLFWVSHREVLIIFVLDDSGKLERTLVFANYVF